MIVAMAAVHVYGVVNAAYALPEDLEGISGRDVRLVSDDGVAALVSDWSGRDEAGRDDLMAHARVLETVAAQHSVLPMRFGTVLEDDDAVRREILAGHTQRLAGLLREFEPLVQLTVKAFHVEEAALREVLRRWPSVAALRDRIAGLPDDATYFARIELGEKVARGLEAVRAADADTVLQRLTPLAVRGEPVAETSGDQVLNHAFLVRRDRQQEFGRAVAQLGRELQQRMRLRFIGPQPPYSFVSTDSQGEPAWA